MAEQEIINHTKEALKVLENKELSLWEKAKDFILEVFIIVFAISLSIWFHNLSENNKEKQLAKTFLLGLKSDIQADIDETKELQGAYKKYTLLYTYLNSLDIHKAPNLDSLKLALQFINTNSYLRAHKSRFNGFLSAGKIMTIENDSLIQKILNYYQEVLPQIESSEKGWINNNASLNNYLVDNSKDYENPIEDFKVLTTSKGKYLTKSLIPWPQLLERYQNIITEGQEITSDISKMYPSNK